MYILFRVLMMHKKAFTKMQRVIRMFTEKRRSSNSIHPIKPPSSPPHQLNLTLGYHRTICLQQPSDGKSACGVVVASGVASLFLLQSLALFWRADLYGTHRMLHRIDSQIVWSDRQTSGGGKARLKRIVISQFPSRAVRRNNQ